MKPTRFALLATLALTACGSPSIEDYAGRTPEADIRTLMDGEIQVWGAFTDRSGDVDPRLTATLHGAWKGDDGTLKEHFLYSDGRTQDREWFIHIVDAHHFTATAADVIGTAQGTQYGDAINITYTLQVTKDGTTHNLQSDDWIYVIDAKHAINRNRLSKFGLTAGELFLSFEKK